MPNLKAKGWWQNFRLGPEFHRIYEIPENGEETKSELGQLFPHLLFLYDAAPMSPKTTQKRDLSAKFAADLSSDPPAISVIVPVYNVENYLKAAVQSVLEQSFTDWELILVDDGSRDRSLELARGFARSDARIRVIALEENTPGGAGIPCNVALKQARGKYVAFLDADDRYLPHFLETLYSHAEVHQRVDVAMLRFEIYYLKRRRVAALLPGRNGLAAAVWCQIQGRAAKCAICAIAPDEILYSGTKGGCGLETFGVLLFVLWLECGAVAQALSQGDF